MFRNCEIVRLPFGARLQGFCFEWGKMLSEALRTVSEAFVKCGYGGGKLGGGFQNVKGGKVYTFSVNFSKV